MKFFLYLDLPLVETILNTIIEGICYKFDNFIRRISCQIMEHMFEIYFDGNILISLLGKNLI